MGKRRIVLLSLACISLMLPLAAYADVIAEPPLFSPRAGFSPVWIIILVAVLAIGTVLLIRTLRKKNKGGEKSTPPKP